MGFLCEAGTVWVYHEESTCIHTRVSAKNTKSLSSTEERLRCPRGQPGRCDSMALGTPSSHYKELLLITLAFPPQARLVKELPAV